MTDATDGSDASSSAPTLDLRVAEVIEARDHPNADRLLVLEIDLGDERRQIVAGIVGHYEPEDLTGQHIVVVANLVPAKLRGELSQGMLLAAENADRLGLLLAVDAVPGTRLTADSAGEPAESVSFEEFQRHELRAAPEGVTMDGEPLEGAELVMDREVYGRLR